MAQRNRPLAVVAVGGNALISDDQHKSLPDQRTTARECVRHIVEMIEQGWDVVISHGNGPQVGFLLRRAELARNELPELPLDICGADTQGATGYIFCSELHNAFADRGIARQAVAVVTQTVVDPNDPAFGAPTKPIGSFLSADEAAVRREKDGWELVEDSGRGWRRVVASPFPQRIVEVDAIRSLVEQGYVVIAAGGGGIPVIESDEGKLSGIEAVIDKDLGSAILARELGAELLLIPTAVEAVAIDFGTPAQRWLGTLRLNEAKQFLADGQFAKGSMGPKVEAAVRYIEDGGQRVIITNLQNMVPALRGDTGTTIIA